MRQSDIISGLVLTVFGLVTIFVIVPDQISGSSAYGVAPDVFPLTLIWATTIFSVVLWVSRLIKGRGGPREESPLPAKDWAFIAAMAVFLAVAVAAIAYLGFIAAGIAIVALLMLVMGERRNPLRLGLVSVITPVALYFVFWSLFNVPLP